MNLETPITPGLGTSAGSLLDDFSLEMVAKDITNLRLAASVIPKGSQISVTFLPGETLQARLSAASAVLDLGCTPVPHISARELASREEFVTFLEMLGDEAAVDRVFVIAGDARIPTGPYEDSLALITSGELGKHGIKCVGVGGYPEGHPHIAEAKLWSALLAKQKILKGFGQEMEIVTQFGFSADPVLAWLERLRGEGVDATVRVGIAGPTNVKTLLRFAARCGVGASTKVLAKYGVSLTKLFATAGPDQLVREFASRFDPALHGQVKLHLYPFGGLVGAAEWAREFRTCA